MNGTPENPDLQKPGDSPDDAASQALSQALASSFAIIRWIMVILVVLFLFSGCFTVEPQQKAIVLRFGKPVGEGDKALLGPGFHWAWPAPIDEVVRIPVGQAQTITSTIGWYANSAANEATGTLPPPQDRLNPDRDGYLVTGDENIVHVLGKLLYRINEAALISSNGVTGYPFAFASASNLVQNAFDNALVYAAAGFRIDDIMTRDVAGFRDRVRARMDQLIAQYQLAIIVDNITLQPLAPLKLKQAFEAVTQAGQSSATLITQARNDANRTISEARAQAQERINAGERERDALVKSVAADADRFKTLLAQYKKDPKLFMQQRRNEVLQRVMTNANYVLVLPPAVNGQPRTVWIPVGPEARPPKVPTPAPAGDEHHGPP